MFRKSTIYFLVQLTISFLCFTCENTHENLIGYPAPTNSIDEEVDKLLDLSENNLFSGNFTYALEFANEVETLLPLTYDGPSGFFV